MLSSATLPLNVQIIWSYSLSNGTSFYVSCVCNHCHRTNQNCRSMMGLTSHLSCFYNAFSSYRVYFSSMTSLTMIVIGTGQLVRAIFLFPLNIPLVVWVAQIRWSCELLKIRWSCQWTIFCWSCQWTIIRWSCQWNIKSWSNRRIDSN